MRVVKEADVRRNEILDAASSLFAERGYDDTSVADIMEAVQIAKGTLYHHFRSKEDILDALIGRQTARLLLAARETAGDKSLPVLERMVRTILALHIDTEQPEGGAMLEQLHRPQNVLMHQKTKRIILKSVPPMLSGIVEDGISQGLFRTQHPLECMEMALCYLDDVLDEDAFELTEGQRREKIEVFLYHMEKLLGMEPGGLASLERVFAGSGR